MTAPSPASARGVATPVESGGDDPPTERPTSRVWRAVRARPGLSSFVALSVGYAGYVVLAVAMLPMNSDKVWTQTILALRGDYGPLKLQASPDNYVLKYPLYLAANAMFGMTFRALAFEIVVMNVVLFGAIAGAYALLARHGVVDRVRGWTVLLVGLWLVSIGDPAGALTDPVNQPTVTFIHPNERNMELGLAVLVLVLAGLMYLGELAARWGVVRRLLAGAALALLAAVLCFDDPYNLYLVLLPLALGGLVRAVQADGPRTILSVGRWQVWYFIALTALLYELATKIAPHLGIHTYSSSQLGLGFVPQDRIATAAQGLFSSLAGVWDGAFFGSHVTGSSLYLLLNALSGFVVSACALTVLRRWHRGRDLVLALLPVAALVMTAAFFLSGRSANPNNVRYLIALVPLTFLVLPTALRRLGAGDAGRVLARLVCVLMVVSIGANVVHTARRAHTVLSQPDVNRSLEQRVAQIGALGLTKGYGEYWDADINTYLSRGKQLTISVVCTGGRLRIYHWLMDESWLRKRATTTFLIWDSTAPQINRCTPGRLDRQFGTPARETSLPRGQYLMIYNYDIGARMAPRPDPKRP